MVSEVYKLYIRIVTPVHVGVDKSKDLLDGIDFKVENGALKIYDQKRLLEKVGDIHQYCNALEKGKSGIDNLLNNLKINVLEIQSKEYKITGHPGELNRQVRDGMYGHALLPGSSIKGALTSVLFTKLRNHQTNVNAVLGNFQSSLNRFIHCTDVSFDRLAAYNAKIFNLHGENPDNLRGGWKHKNNTNINFNNDGFTFAFETVQPGFSAPFTLRFNKNMYVRYISEAGNNDRLKQLPHSARNFQNTTDFQKELFSILYGHTSDYLNREIEFFKKFNQAEHSDKIMESLKNIQKIHTKEAPVFRLASGSGFHSITGDWQFDSHDINGIEKVTTRKGKLLHHRGLYNGTKSAKSRRFAFNQNDKGEYEFYPMGFVQIMTKEYYEQYVQSREDEKREREAAALQKRKAEKLKRLEDEKKAEKEAKAPKWIERKKLSKKKPKTIDAVVIGQRGKMMVVKPYVKGYENTELETRYPAGMEKGTVINIDVRLAGKSLQIQGYPKKK